MLFLTISNGAIDFSVSFCYNVPVQCHRTVREQCANNLFAKTGSRFGTGS